MKNKAAVLFSTWAFVILAYIILSFIMPTFTSTAATTAATINASSNMTNYPGTYASVTILPFMFWFVPGAIGVVVTVVTLRARPGA